MAKTVLLSRLSAAVLVLMSAPLFAAGAKLDLEPSGIDPDNINSLQRGAANFMIEACLATGAHYFDITGEAFVFEHAHSAAIDERAKQAGIVVCPGVGFDVVPTDCVARTLVEALPDATELELGFASAGRFSPGTAKTMVEGLGLGTFARRNGRLERTGILTREIDFGSGPRMGGAFDGVDTPYEGVCTDTRSLSAGDLFVALKGPNFDGADYLDAAARLGAVAAVVTRLRESDLPQIVVDDTYEALGKLGSAWRDGFELDVVGLTGSNGKTTLKELISGILQRVGPTLATEGNFNNHIGVPLMDDFAQALSDADVLIVLDVYAAGEAPIAGADGRAIARAVRSRGAVEPVFVETLDELLPVLKDLLREGDLLLTMGAGDIGAFAQTLPERLAQQPNLKVQQ